MASKRGAARGVTAGGRDDTVWTHDVGLPLTPGTKHTKGRQECESRIQNVLETFRIARTFVRARFIPWDLFAISLPPASSLSRPSTNQSGGCRRCATRAALREQYHDQVGDHHTRTDQLPSAIKETEGQLELKRQGVT